MSGNTLDGFYIYTSSATANTLSGNHVGVTADGAGALGNGRYGLYIHSGANANTIGGPTASHGNVVSGNGTGDAGIMVTGASTDGNIVRHNKVGTNSAGTAPIANNLHGVRVDNAPDTQILDNLISGNDVHGVYVFDTGSTGTLILRNTIGTNGAQIAALPNAYDGIRLEGGSSGTVIGAAGSGNVVSGNTQDGITINDNNDTVIQGNYIGTDSTATRTLGNGGHGIFNEVYGSSNNLIGGDGPGEGNTIAHNNRGVVLDSGNNNTVIGNGIHSNTSLGIDLGLDGVTGNDPGDGDSGPNGLLNYPVITSAIESGGTVTVDFDLDVPANPDQYRVEFFTNPSGANGAGNYEAETFLSAVTKSPGTGLTHTFAGSAGDVVTATATRIDTGASSGYASTSEISSAATVVSSAVVVNSTGNASDAIPGDDVCDTGGTNSEGDPACTLRAAIQEANASATIDTVRFAMPATESGHSGGVWTISPGSALPTVSTAMTIDGTTQPGWTTTPVVELDGALAGGGSNGLSISGDNVEVRGLAIGRFGGDGILVQNGSSGGLIAGNHLGLDASGIVDRGNGDRGIDLTTGSGPTTVGGTSAADRNVISGNGNDGIVIWQSDGNTVIGNYIGTDVTGLLSIPNSQDGISLGGTSSNNVIGQPGAGNVLSGNGHDGLELDNDLTGNVIQANIMGLGADGSTLVANTRHGLVIYDGVNNTDIGGSGAGEGNIISGNPTNGIMLDGNANPATANNRIEGNLIGTDATGLLDRGNGGAGIYFYNGANTTTVGGATAGHRNVISGNGTDGVYLQNAGTTGNVIKGNYIGVDITGNAPLPNNDRGVQIESGANNTIVGGSAAGEGNVISANGNDGIIISDGASPGTGTTGTIIEGNLIGGGADGTTALGNGTNGVRVTTEDGHRIGGTAAGAGNTIARNTEDGVMVQNSSANLNPILGNDIYANGQLGIDLGNDGVTGNDAGDGDSGANDLLNFPVITSAEESAGTVTVTFDLDVPANPEQYRVEFFSNPSGADASGNGEGESFLSATTAGPGTGITHTFAGSAGDVVTATATRIDSGAAAGFASTSELSAPITVASAVTHSISGTVFEDVVGDVLSDGTIGDANNPGAGSVDVHLYLDTDGDGIAEATDTFHSTLQTDPSGAYTFSGLSSGKYFVVVDLKTVTPAAGTALPGDVWAEQTYGPGFRFCANGSGGTVAVTPAGPCYGGRRAGVSDDLTTWYSGAEHLASVSVPGADVTGVDFGFSFNVVTTSEGGDSRDDDTGANRTVQGSLRQFIQNANAITGANTMRFVPAEPAGATDGGGNSWWRVSVTSALPVLTDGSTTIDGAAFDFTDGSSVLDTNTATLGTAGSVGVGADGRPGTGDEVSIAAVAGPELEIADGVVSGRLPRGLDTDADDTTIRRLAIWGFGSTADGDIQAGGDAGDTARTGFLLEDAVVGATPVGGDPGAEASVTGLYADDWSDGTVRRSHVAHTSFAGARFWVGLPNWAVEDSHFESNGTSGGIQINNTGSFTIARNRFVGNGDSGVSVIDPPTTVVVTDNTFDGNTSEGAAIGDINASTVTRNLFQNNSTVGLWIGAVSSSVSDNTMRLNGTYGVFVTLGTSTLAVDRNLVEDNGSVGVRLYVATGVTMTDNQVTGSGATGVLVDGTGATLTTNTITGNTGPGVVVKSGAGQIAMDRNLFGANEGNAIDLSATTATLGDGVTANTATPPSCGTDLGVGNGGLDTPIIDDASATTVTGRACAGATVQVYRAVADGDGSDTSAGTDYGEGVEHVGTTTADGSGDWTLAGITGLAAGDAVAATATKVSQTSEFSANVVANRPPVFDQDLLDRSDAEASWVSLSAAATDPDPADTLVYSATGLPLGLSIDPDSGLVSGMINHAAAASSPYSVEISVTDGVNPAVTDTFAWTVTDVASSDPYLVAGTGGIEEGTICSTTVDPASFDPVTNEVDIGTGTATSGIEAAAIEPLSGVLYAADGDQLGTLDVELRCVLALRPRPRHRQR